MSIVVVFQQMIVIFLMILIGIFLYKKGAVTAASAKTLSFMIVNVTNPCLLITSAISDGEKLSSKALIIGFGATLLVYLFMIVCSYLIPIFLKRPRKEHYIYQMLTVYGNVGFIGIPLASAVLGNESLIYVAMNNLVFNLLIYTHGMAIIRKAAIENKPAEEAAALLEKLPTDYKGKLLQFINVGTLSSLAAVILYLCPIKVPSVLSDTLLYTGRATTFMSMVVLGVSVATMNPKEVFGRPVEYIYSFIRMLVLPISCLLLLRFITDDALLLGACALMLGVPCANMPLMLAKQFDMDDKPIANTIILTTLLSLVTIPIVTLFVT